MRYLFNIILGLLLLSSCSENERMLYSDMPGVYFPNYTSEADSLVYSFRIKWTDRDTIFINVKLLGALLDEPGEFGVAVSEHSTAVAGKHYVALPETFTYEANKITTSFPIVVLNSGNDLDDKMVTLELSLVPTGSLSVGYPDRLNMRLMLTNQLVRPSYWDMPLSLYFGEYSKVKHQQCVLMMGHDFPLTEGELSGWGGVSGYKYWMLQGRVLCEYYATHTVEDEYGNIIAVWNPF